MNSVDQTQVFLSLGTNIGNRILNLKKAVTMLQENLSTVTLSRVYETEPLYKINQPLFLNCVARGMTNRSPENLLGILQGIEQNMGRDRDHIPDKGPRVIDIDILLYDQEIIRTEILSIPHPGMYEREFVLIPLLELAPELKDPESGLLFSGFLDKLGKQGCVLYADLNEII